MRYTLFFLVSTVLLSQTFPMEVHRGKQDGTMQISIPVATLPMVRASGEWRSTLEVTYIIQGEGGAELDRAGEAVEIKMDDRRRRFMLSQALTLTRPLGADPRATALRVEVRHKGSSAFGAAKLELSGAPFYVGGGVALVPFQVARPEAKMVTGLTAADVRLLEDGVEQAATVYAAGVLPAESAPVEIALLYDCSGSVRAGGSLDPLVVRKGMLDSFPEARIAVYGFSEGLTQLVGFTRSEAELRRASGALQGVQARGTYLFSNIAEVVRRFDRTHAAIRIVVVFSDGETNRTWDSETATDVMRLAREAGVAIYPVYTGPPMDMTQPRPGRPPSAPRMSAGFSAADFQRLTETGGRSFTKANGADLLPLLLGEIAKTVKESYVAGYQPAAGEKARARRVQVALRDPERGVVIGGSRTVVK